MQTVIFVSLIALILSFLASKGKIKYGLEAAFILLTFIGAIHYEYGNDYSSYVDMFEKYSQDSLFAPISKDIFRDPGWAVLCRLFRPIGFFGMVIVLNVFQNVIYYGLIKKYSLQSWWWICVFFYVFSTNLYLINFSMMRQGFVIAVFASLLPFILHKRIYVTFPVIFVLLFIHSSALILLPFSFWGFIPIKNGKLIVTIFICLFVLFLIGGSFVNSLFGSLFSIKELSEYSSYNTVNAGLTFGFGFLGDMIPFVLSLFFIVSKSESEDKKKLVALSSIGSILIPFQQVLMMAGRVGWYFAPFKMLSIFLIYSVIKDKYIRIIVLLVFILLTIYRYNLFFTDGAFTDSYSAPFKTIFSVPWI